MAAALLYHVTLDSGDVRVLPRDEIDPADRTHQFLKLEAAALASMPVENLGNPACIAGSGLQAP